MTSINGNESIRIGTESKFTDIERATSYEARRGTEEVRGTERCGDVVKLALE